jgi:hypothetical protein
MFSPLLLLFCRGENVRQPVIDGAKICEPAYYSVIGICRETYFDYKRKAAAKMSVVPRNRNCARKPKTIMAMELFKVGSLHNFILYANVAY